MRIACYCIVALILSGCSTHPLPEQVARQSTLAIVTAIRCEARQAILEHAAQPEYNGGVIGYIFDFNITEHNNAGFDLSLKKPFGAGEFSLAFAGTNSDLKRQAERRFTIVDTFEELKQVQCSDELGRTRFKYPITGSIGLNEVIATFMGIDKLDLIKFQVADNSAKTIGGHTASFSDELTYTTMLDSGSITPKLTLDAVPGVLRLTILSGTMKSDRTDIHKVILALALPEPKKLRPKHAVRMAARKTQSSRTFIGGIPSKIQIHSESDPRARVLLELDRRVLLSKAIVVAP